MKKLIRRIRYFIHRRALERELADEIAAHREMMPAERRTNFGAPLRLREEAHDVWAFVWLEQLWQDLSYGARMLWRSKGFTAAAVTVLALGVGVNLAEYQIFDAVAFHRLSIPHADSIMEFFRVAKSGRRLAFPLAAVDLYRGNSGLFSWLVAEGTRAELTVENDTALRANFVSGNYFQALRIIPAWGRLLTEEDSQPGAAPVVVLGYSYWLRHWARDPSVVGRMVHVNNRLARIVGVAPCDFDGISPRGTAVWAPAVLRPFLIEGSAPPDDLSTQNQELYGLLKPGISFAAGTAQLTALTRELSRRQPRWFTSDERISGWKLEEMRGQDLSVKLVSLLVLLVLFSACANLGNLLLARGLGRQREIDTRVALGAGRARVFRQLMTENVFLALLGSAAGLALGTVVARFLLQTLDAPPDIRVRMNWQVIALGALSIVVSAFAFGLPAALRAVRRDQKRGSFRQALVAVQVAVSCLLLIASGVIAHSAIRGATIDLAFDYRNIVVVSPPRNLSAVAAREKLAALSASLALLPGVDGVSVASVVPLFGLDIQNRPGLPPIYFNSVAPSYFALMNLPVLRGRTFMPGERDSVIVGEAGARQIWPDRDPLGQQLVLEDGPHTVVGVARDSGMNLLANDDAMEVYVPHEGAYAAGGSLILHTRGDPAPIMRLIPPVAARNGVQVVTDLMRTKHDEFFAGERATTLIVGSIGGVATALAAAGMFALVAFAVAQRTRELGIRMAIGARHYHILGELLRQNLKPTAVGVVAGVILSALLARLVHQVAFLKSTGTLDPVGFIAGLVVFALIAAIASLVPALRALRIDPASTLRCE